MIYKLFSKLPAVGLTCPFRALSAVVLFITPGRCHWVKLIWAFSPDSRNLKYSKQLLSTKNEIAQLDSFYILFPIFNLQEIYVLKGQLISAQRQRLG